MTSLNRQQRAPVRDLLRQKDHQYAPMITTVQDLQALKQEYSGLNNVDIGRDGRLDTDYPTTPQAQQECVRQLFLAITDFSDVIESANHLQLPRVKDMSNFEVHVIAWNILVSSRTPVVACDC